MADTFGEGVGYWVGFLRGNGGSFARCGGTRLIISHVPGKYLAIGLADGVPADKIAANPACGFVAGIVKTYDIIARLRSGIVAPIPAWAC